MNIVNNIDRQIELMMKPVTGPILAREIAEAALAALLAGIGRFDENERVVVEPTEQWQKYMEFFAETPAELNRLCGKEADFNRSDWGLLCLAYMSGDGACTSLTNATTGQKRSMLLVEKLDPNRKMLENLDAEDTDLAKFKKR